MFATLAVPCAKILAIYKLRWNGETDLRSLRRTVDLHQIHSQSVDLVEKETPRQLSFSFVQTAVEAALPALRSASSAAQYNRQMERLLDYAVQAKLA